MRDPGEIVNLLKTCSTAHTCDKVSFLMTPSSALLESVALKSERASDLSKVKLSIDTRPRISGTTFGIDETPRAVSESELESPTENTRDIDEQGFKVKAR